MTIFDAVIFILVAALIGMKVMLLAAAAVLFVSVLRAYIRRRKTALRRSSAGHPRLDLWA